MPFSHLDPKQVFIRDGHDPVVRALHEIRAEEVPLETFRMCNGALGLETPFLGSDYRVWALAKRKTCSRSHGWTVGLRIGDPPSGILTDNIKSVKQTSPGIRKANFREVIAFLQASQQIAVPATQSTDANLGFAFYAYPSASVALPPGETRKYILMRVEGTASQGGIWSAPPKGKSGLLPMLLDYNAHCSAAVV